MNPFISFWCEQTIRNLAFFQDMQRQWFEWSVGPTERRNPCAEDLSERRCVHAVEPVHLRPAALTEKYGHRPHDVSVEAL